MRARRLSHQRGGHWEAPDEETREDPNQTEVGAGEPALQNVG